MICPFNVILGSPILGANVRNSLVGRVEVILSSSGVVINVVVLLIWVSLVAMCLSNFKKNSLFNCLIMIIWVKKHVLIIGSGVEEMINIFLLRFDENRFFLDQILRVLMLKEWTEIRISALISFFEWNITIFIFFIVNLILFSGKPKLNLFVLEHLLLVVTNISIHVAQLVSI